MDHPHLILSANALSIKVPLSSRLHFTNLSKYLLCSCHDLFIYQSTHTTITSMSALTYPAHLHALYRIIQCGRIPSAHCLQLISLSSSFARYWKLSASFVLAKIDPMNLKACLAYTSQLLTSRNREITIRYCYLFYPLLHHACVPTANICSYCSFDWRQLTQHKWGMNPEHVSATQR